MMIPRYDLVISSDRVIDPASGLDGPAQIAVTGGRVTAVAEALPPHQSGKTVRVILFS